ncbi:unnamed protein product [Peniophora sp. CBMAI 1063]|nr:unnamed protein product [Peniophora sp. CBMAI 1063]
MSLTTIPLELWQNIALEVVADVISTRDIRSGSLALPDSLLAPLEPDSFRYPGTFEDSTEQNDVRPRGFHTDACIYETTSNPVPSQAHWYGKSKDSSPISVVASLLAIDRRRRQALYDLPEFWEGVALLIPAATSHALKCTDRRPGISLDFTSHLLLCPCMLKMLKPRLSKATRIDVAFSGELSGNTNPSWLLGQWLGSLPHSGLQHLEHRYALSNQLDWSSMLYREHRELQIELALNPSTILWGGALRRLSLAAERRDRAIPADELLLLLTRCLSLEVLALQMVLAPFDDTPPVALPVSLPHLRYFLLCGEIAEWQSVWPKIAIPETASVHADLILPRLDIFLDSVDRFVAEATVNCLNGPGFPSCRVVILHYQTKIPTDRPPDDESPELVTLTFAATEEEAWAEKNPEHLSRRWTFTVRFPGGVLDTRYPPGPGEDGMNVGRVASHELLVSSICWGIENSAAQIPAVDLKTTEVLIVKAGGRLRHMVDFYHLTPHFPNLKDLVLYGVFNRDSYALKSTIRELRDGTWRSVERVCLPDYEGSGWRMDGFKDQEDRQVRFSPSFTNDDGAPGVHIFHYWLTHISYECVVIHPFPL